MKFIQTVQQLKRLKENNLYTGRKVSHMKFKLAFTIKTEEDFAKAVDELEKLWFYAEMSDDYRRELAEKEEIREMYRDVLAQAQAKGISTEYHSEHHRWHIY